MVEEDKGSGGEIGASATRQPAGALRPEPLRVSGEAAHQAHGLRPRPNWQTRATFTDMIEWATAVEEGRWSWVRNSECKYGNLKIDTRSGAYRIEDRDGNEISLADLRRQFGRDSGIEARRAATGNTDAVHESAVPPSAGDATRSPRRQPNV